MWGKELWLEVFFFWLVALANVTVFFGGGFADGVWGLCSSPFEKSVLMMGI
jgi:hypothetical protein